MMGNEPQHSEQAPVRGRSTKRDRALETLTFGSRTTGDDAAARSRLVRRLRILLPVAALVMVVLLLLNTRSDGPEQAFLDDFKSVTASTEELRMANPRFAGIDDSGKPFEITAEAASQNPGEKDVIELHSPRALQGDGDETTLVTAANGTYRSTENILELNEDVTLEHDIGAQTYKLSTPTATVRIKDQVVISDEGIGALGPDGEQLKADRMTAYRDDGRVVFEGNVSMRIYPGSTDVASTFERSIKTEKEVTP